MFLLQTTPTGEQTVYINADQMAAIDSRMAAMQHDMVLVMLFCLLCLSAMALMMALR